MKNNDNSSISYREAVKVENPYGVPLSKTMEDYTPAFSGNLLLSYDPPGISKSEVNTSVVGRIKGTNAAFSGILTSEFPGDVFMPSQDLVASIQKAVAQMEKEIEESGKGKTPENILTMTTEEFLNYCIVNVPVKQIYERIRKDYPIEFRRMNVEYKRRRGGSLVEDLDNLLKEQQEYRFANISIGLFKFALKKKDLVVLDKYELKKLEKPQAELYKKINEELSAVHPINGKYIVFEDPDNGNVSLMGKNKNSESGYAKTDTIVPESILDKFEQEEEEESYLTNEEQTELGMDKTEDEIKLNESYDGLFGSFGIPLSVYSDPKAARENSEKILTLYKKILQTKKAVPKKLISLVKKLNRKPSVKQTKPQVRKVNIQSQGIPETVYTDKSIANQYADKILKMWQYFADQNIKINDQNFNSLVENIRRDQIERRQQQKNTPAS